MDEMNTVGTLYIVATPIGNARDMTERGRQILETADIIAAEDTRRSVVLLNKLGIRGNQLSANHKFNEYGKAKWFIEQLQQGKSIAVITDAGTPCISDPGNELIRAAIDAGIRVVGVPGCCAAVTVRRRCTRAARTVRKTPNARITATSRVRRRTKRERSEVRILRLVAVRVPVRATGTLFLPIRPCGRREFAAKILFLPG